MKTKTAPTSMQRKLIELKSQFEAELAECSDPGLEHAYKTSIKTLERLEKELIEENDRTSDEVWKENAYNFLV